MHVKVKNSLRMKLAVVLLCLTAGTFLIYFLINQFFLEDYYLHTKEKSLLKGYHKISEILSDSGAITTESANQIVNVCEKYGITIIVVDTADNIKLQYGNGAILQQRLQQINFGFNLNNENTKVIKETDKYVLQSYNLDKSNGGYMEVSGFFNKNMIFLMRMAVQSINESVSISMKFFVYVGTFVSLIGIIVAFVISGEFTRPILHLADISKEMSNLNFNVKYENKSNDELGILGESMNELSDKLESTIIDLKQANYKLQSDIEQKEKIDEMRKDFISNASHELKTPIALIQGYAEGLSECVNDDADSREFYCEVIIDEANKMNKLVKNLLSLNQLEYGSSMIQYEKFDISMVIKGVINKLDYPLKQKEAVVDFVYAGKLFVYADEFKIEEVITNYLTNAINHLDENKIIKVNISQNDKKIRVSVFNSGKQIPDNELENIWIKFYKVDKARTREYGGSGIGLSIVKAIMNAHNNECGVLNKKNGVEFWFELDTELC